MRLRHTAALAVSALGLLTAVGCGSDTGSGGSGTASGGRLAVVATTTQLGDFVREVGGSDVTVTQILKPNSDPHDYEPRPDDVKATAGAKLILESGNNLDQWMGDVVGQAGGKPTVVDLADSNVARVPGETSGPEASKYDPHWWHDPRNAEAAVRAIGAALGEADADHRARYTQRANAYAAEVKQLDAGIVTCLAGVPTSARKLVTDHDAFNYFAKRYGITVVGSAR